MDMFKNVEKRELIKRVKAKPYETMEITKESYQRVLSRFPERAKELDVEMTLHIYKRHNNLVDYQFLNDAVKTDLGVCKIALKHMNVERLHAGVYGNNMAMLELFYEFQDKYEGKEILEEMFGQRRNKVFPDREYSVDEAIQLHKKITQNLLDDESRYDKDFYYEHQRVLMSRFCNDEKFIYATVEHFGSNIDRTVPDWMKADKELALKAIESNAGLYTILHHFDPEIQLDREVALFAAAKNHKETLPYKFRNDPVFVEVVIEEHIEILMRKMLNHFNEDVRKKWSNATDDEVNITMNNHARHIFDEVASDSLKKLVGNSSNVLQSLSLLRMKKELEADLDDTKKPAKKQKL
jgi:predicted RNA-binding protein Jag